MLEEPRVPHGANDDCSERLREICDEVLRSTCSALKLFFVKFAVYCDAVVRGMYTSRFCNVDVEESCNVFLTLTYTQSHWRLQRSFSNFASSHHVLQPACIKAIEVHGVIDDLKTDLDELFEQFQADVLAATEETSDCLERLKESTEPAATWQSCIGDSNTPLPTLQIGFMRV